MTATKEQLDWFWSIERAKQRRHLKRIPKMRKPAKENENTAWIQADRTVCDCCNRTLPILDYPQAKMALDTELEDYIMYKYEDVEGYHLEDANLGYIDYPHHLYGQGEGEEDHKADFVTGLSIHYKDLGGGIVEPGTHCILTAENWDEMSEQDRYWS
tara:strand:- start:536 stop:1006 length:471 start_codon:yes stop_codon:yes gene_type:complete